MYIVYSSLSSYLTCKNTNDHNNVTCESACRHEGCHNVAIVEAIEMQHETGNRKGLRTNLVRTLAALWVTYVSLPVPKISPHSGGLYDRRATFLKVYRFIQLILYIQYISSRTFVTCLLSVAVPPAVTRAHGESGTITELHSRPQRMLCKFCT